MHEYLTFRKFITPIAIQVLFWIGLVLVVIAGLFTAGMGLSRGIPAAVLLGVGYIILGPIFVRIYCEVLIVIFRVLDVLQDIKQNTKPGGGQMP